MRICFVLLLCVASLPAAPSAARAEELAPRIDHVPLTRATPGEAQTFRARIVSLSGKPIGEATVFVRIPGVPGFNRLNMQPEGMLKDVYFAQMPGHLVTTEFDYYLEAFDADGNGPARAGSPEAAFHVAVGAAPKPAPASATPPAAPLPTPGASVGALSISGSPEGCSVSVTGQGKSLSGTLPWSARDLPPGSYRVEARHAGSQTIARDVQVGLQQETRVIVSLAPAADEEELRDDRPAARPGASNAVVSSVPISGTTAVAPTPAASSPRPEPAKASPAPVAATAPAPAAGEEVKSSAGQGQRNGGILLAVLGGAGVAAGAVFAGLNLHQKTAIQNGDFATGRDMQDAASTGGLYGTVSIVSFAAGVAAAAVGTALLISAPSAAPASGVSVMPTATPSGAGLCISGRLP